MSQATRAIQTSKPARFIDQILPRYATQATAALFVVVAVTGVMMFFKFYKGEVEGVHEWLGLGFAAVVALHLVRNRRSFAQMLKQGRMRVLFLLALAGSAGFILLSPPKQPNPTRQATQRMLSAPLANVSPVLGMSAEQAVDELQRAGVGDATPDASLNKLARAHGKEPAALLSELMAAPARQ
ncbi:protein of unknown function [Noviherbaspirillum humi]|uniref:Flavinylation-associated cytochrome domain-containing protein n=1 Tax=Noviherbaspirillum humi TaxID=1688639 RepID=A0A239KNN3_9BURK|nr:DUF4405 domain-containing protein [Noviherbaspirillum humi]SNT19223.1 protein of unknown function [Noviherbaspirillum humi]